MLIVIVSMFLLLEIPLTITTILHVIQNITSINFVEYNTLNTIILITNFFIILSYPINFAIYCGMSRQFRTTFSELFLDGQTGICRRCWCLQKCLPVGGSRGLGGGRLGGGGEGGSRGGRGGNGVFGAAVSERVTTAFITGASSSTFGVTSKSYTSCMNGPDAGGGGSRSESRPGSRKQSSETVPGSGGVHVIVGVVSNGSSGANEATTTILGGTSQNHPQNYREHQLSSQSSPPISKSIQIGDTEVIDYEPEEEPQVLETSL